MATTVSDVLASSLVTRTSLDEQCLTLSHRFVKDLADAEEAYACAVQKASGALVAGLLDTKFDGDDSLRRSALIASSKWAAAKASELHAHAREQAKVGAALAVSAAEAKAAAAREASARAARERDEQAAEYAFAESRQRENYAHVAATAAGAATASDPWLETLHSDVAVHSAGNPVAVLYVSPIALRHQTQRCLNAIALRQL